ncbi:MAG: SGNH/GDSL hydrolase family protein [Bdellovibrionota bacterium]
MKLKIKWPLKFDRLKLLSALLFLICAGFLAGTDEALCKLIDPTAAFGDNNGSACYIWNPLVGYAAKPGSHCSTYRSGQLYDFRINREGLRGPDYSPAPRKGTKRIFIVGASSMFAPGLKESETPAALLERNLRRAGQKVEVINVSVEGYSAIQLFIRFKQWINAYHPDIVLFNLTAQHLLTDQMLTMVSSDSSSSTLLPERVSSDPFLLTPIPIAQELKKHARLQKIVSAVMLFYQRFKISWRYKLSESGTERENKWMDISVRSMQKIQEMSEKEKFKFFVFVFSPNGISNDTTVSPALDLYTAKFFDLITPAVRFPITALLRVLQEKKLPHFVLPFPEGEASFLPKDYHFSVIGTKFVADQLFSKRSLYMPGGKKKK